MLHGLQVFFFFFFLLGSDYGLSIDSEAFSV